MPVFNGLARKSCKIVFYILIIVIAYFDLLYR